MADVSKPSEPVAKVEDSIGKQDTSEDHDGRPQTGMTSTIKVHSSPQQDKGTANTKEEPNKWVGAGWKIAPLLISLLALGVSWSSRNASHRAADIAERALNTNIENFRLDQRAWINVGRTIYPSELKAGVSQVDTIGMEFVNSGKTQAIDVRAVIAARTMFKDVPFSPAYQGTAPNSRTNLRPGVPFSVRLPNVTLSQEQVTAIRSGSLRLYVYGEISYQDIFTSHHCTKFCIYFSPDLKETGFCGVYNEMTDTECDHAR